MPFGRRVEEFTYDTASESGKAQFDYTMKAPALALGGRSCRTTPALRCPKDFVLRPRIAADIEHGRVSVVTKLPSLPRPLPKGRTPRVAVRGGRRPGLGGSDMFRCVSENADPIEDSCMHLRE